MTDQSSGSPTAPGPINPLHFPCASCGARLEYAPGTTALKCPYCGFEQQVAPVGAQIQEHSYDEWAALPSKPRAQLGAHLLKCKQCGAQIETDDLSSSCSFCGAPVVVEVSADPQIAPEAVVPFQIVRRAAEDAILTWVRSRWFAPTRLKKSGTSEIIKGTYLPFWTFDASTESDYRGMRGEHYWETETYTDDEGNTQTREVMRTAWYPARGHVARDFDDVLVPASGHLPAQQLASMGPWDLENATAFQPEYLSGFRTLRYDIEPDQGLAAAKAEMARVIDGDCRDDIGGDEQQVASVDTSYSNVMFKLVLMPVWIAAYLYGGRTFQVLVNARTGAVVGERPYSVAKIVATVTAAVFLIVLILLVYSRTKR